MIGRSGNVNPPHEHNVTNCIHNTQSNVKDKGGGGGGIPSVEGQREVEKQENISQNNFSFYTVITNGLKSIRSRAIDFWNGSNDEGKIPVDTLSTLIVKDEGKRKDEIAEDINAEAEEARKVKTVEGAVSGGLKKEQGNIKKFFQNISEAISKVKKPWEKPEVKEEQENILPVELTGYNKEDNSYLLDSYNKTGEYSSLGKDHSLDGDFKAKG